MLAGVATGLGQSSQLNDPDGDHIILSIGVVKTSKLTGSPGHTDAMAGTTSRSSGEITLSVVSSSWKHAPFTVVRT